MRVRSGYSFREAYGFLEDVMDRIHSDYAPLTDTSAYGWMSWTKLCRARGKRPVYGLEVNVTHEIGEKRPGSGTVTLIARDSLEPLHRALELTTAQFKYRPLLTYVDLASIDCEILIGRDIKANLLPDREGRPYWIGYGPGMHEDALELSDQKGWPLVASSDNRYPAPEDAGTYQLISGKFSQTAPWKQHILIDDEFDCRLAIDGRDRLAGLCNAEMIHASPVQPKGGLDLMALCIDGAKARGIDITTDPYKSRLHWEMSVITSKDFEGYFLILSDLTTFAREKMFVGPARGSAAGSLVCYLTGITDVDPIRFGLLFERFLDPSRDDTPDIDLDFSDAKRKLVIEYLARQYGQEHVSQLGTVNFFRARSLINEVASGAIGIPPHRLKQLVVAAETAEDPELWPILTGTEFGEKLLEEYPELDVIPRIDGHPRHAGRHASGIVVTDKPVVQYAAIDSRTNSCQIDKRDAESLGLVKIDVLGLKQLSAFEDALALIGKPNSWLQSAPLDDPAVFQTFNNAHFSGVFQWNGETVRGITRSVTVRGFEDLVAITSLARPGPMASGGTERWIKIRRGEEPVSYYHEAFKEILEPTDGIVIYQEQVMRACSEVGGLPMSEVNKLRKAISKSGGSDAMAKWREAFIDGAEKHGVPRPVSEGFWRDMLAYGSYAFNRSHAVAYAIISYWCAYLKTYHPMQFAAGTLNHESEDHRKLEILRELDAEGIGYVAVSKESTLKWQVIDGRLVGPLTNIKGVGYRKAQDYMTAVREGRDPTKYTSRRIETAVTPLDSLTPISDSVLKCVGDLESVGIMREPTRISELTQGPPQRDVIIVGKLESARSRADEKGGMKMTAVIRDDTGEIRIFISSRNYRQMANALMETGKGPGHSLWAIKGDTPDGGGIIFTSKIRYLGDT